MKCWCVTVSLRSSWCFFAGLCASVWRIAAEERARCAEDAEQRTSAGRRPSQLCRGAGLLRQDYPGCGGRTCVEHQVVNQIIQLHDGKQVCCIVWVQSVSTVRGCGHSMIRERLHCLPDLSLQVQKYFADMYWAMPWQVAFCHLAGNDVLPRKLLWCWTLYCFVLHGQLKVRPTCLRQCSPDVQVSTFLHEEGARKQVSFWKQEPGYSFETVTSFQERLVGSFNLRCLLLQFCSCYCSFVTFWKCDVPSGAWLNKFCDEVQWWTSWFLVDSKQPILPIQQMKQEHTRAVRLWQFSVAQKRPTTKSIGFKFST